MVIADHILRQVHRASICFQMLLDKGAQIDEKDENGDQPIHYAAKSGCIACVQLIAGKGVKVCTPGQNDNRVIHYAAKYGRLELVNRILEKGCPPDLQNQLGETPLHLASSFYTKGIDIYLSPCCTVFILSLKCPCLAYVLLINAISF